MLPDISELDPSGIFKVRASFVNTDTITKPFRKRFHLGEARAAKIDGSVSLKVLADTGAFQVKTLASCRIMAAGQHVGVFSQMTATGSLGDANVKAKGIIAPAPGFDYTQGINGHVYIDIAVELTPGEEVEVLAYGDLTKG